MAQEIVSIACGDDFTNAATILDVFDSGGGAFQVSGNAAKYILQYGNRGDNFFTDEATIGLGGGIIPPGVTGVRFRNAVASSVAVVSALIRHKAQPHLALSFPALATGGMITGSVDAAGNIVAGTGFTVVHNGAGDFSINFTTPFAAAPAVVFHPLQTLAGGVFHSQSNAPTVTQARVILKSAAGAGADLPFNFIASPMT